MKNEEKILEMLETLVTKVTTLEEGQVETNERIGKIEEGQVETNEHIGELEEDIKGIKDDVVVIKEDVRFTRRLVKEAFKDIGMLDERTQILHRV